jgi:hypothetical protein
MATLTAANSIITLAVAGVFSAPVQLQGYDVDDVFSTEAVETGETRMGVDGRLSAGFVFSPVTVEYTLQADSPSILLFENWDAAEQAAAEKLYASGSVRLPAVGRQYTKVHGVLTRVPRMPSAGKLLKPRKFTITWQQITPGPL